MYKLIIVDDEPRIVSLLTTILDWESMGFEVVYTCNDGSDVIKYIEQNPADCILSDIRMITMSGLELAEYLYNNYPSIKIVLLSAYQEFNYALKALKYNVSDYILKPLDIEQLKVAMTSLKNELNSRSSEAADDSLYVHFLLKNLINGKYSSFSDIKTALEFISTDSIKITADTACAVLKVNFTSSWTYGIEDMKENLLHNVTKIDNPSILAQFVSYDETTAVYILFSSLSDKKSFYDFSGEIAENLTTLLQTQVDFECQCFDNVNALLVSANNTADSSSAEITSGFQEKIINAVISGQIMDVIDYISVLIKLELSDGALKQMLIRIINQLDLHLSDLGSTEEHVRFTQFISTLKDIHGAENIKNVCTEYFTEISEFFSQYCIDDTKSSILWARNYIAEHYNEDISLNTIASLIHLSPKYFSKKFKQIIGDTYTSFIISCRMNHAKEMLIKTNDKISDISINVGYPNANFFTRLFKSYYNISPGDYREKYKRSFDLEED